MKRKSSYFYNKMIYHILQVQLYLRDNRDKMKEMNEFQNCFYT